MLTWEDPLHVLKEKEESQKDQTVQVDWTRHEKLSGIYNSRRCRNERRERKEENDKSARRNMNTASRPNAQ